MILTKPTLQDVLYVAQNMREWDRREIFATRWDDSADSLAMDAMRIGEMGFIGGLPGEPPIAFIGAQAIWPGVWSVWMFATDRFPAIGLGMTRFVRRQFKPAIMSGDGFQKAMCWSMEGHNEAQDWLRLLGAKPEATVANYGRSGENFTLFSWSN